MTHTSPDTDPTQKTPSPAAPSTASPGQSLTSRLQVFLQSEKVFWSVASALVGVAFLTRLLFLTDKPFHHDESLHGYYSERVAQGSPHEYSALLHGPLLYYLVGAFLALLGTNDFTARLPAALFGVLLVASPLLITRQVGRLAVLALMTLLVVSPTFMYFGRFLREDVFTSTWVVGIVFGTLIFWQTRKPWAAYFATSMLAFHFVNKENSYLHTGLWLLCLGAMVWLGRQFACFSFAQGEHFPSEREPALAGAEKGVFALNCTSIFVTIYVLFYSSFFRHSKGSMHGIIDGIYRESLLYWWDQNSKRRIDGPFDYHLPLIANYEFVVLPILLLAWIRLFSLARARQEKDLLATSPVAPAAPFFLAGPKFAKVTLATCGGLVALAFLAPKVAFVPEACEYSAHCLDQKAHETLTKIFAFLAKTLHISHSRHLLQIISYVVCGGVAYLSALHLRRKADAFLWFWLTGALGMYSYVGEKVPWLLVYILLPLFMIAALEIARLFSSDPLPSDTWGGLGDSRLARVSESLNGKVRFVALAWLALSLPFSAFKAVRVSFPNAANTSERLVFTQTLREPKLLRDRWRQAAKAHTSGNVRITMWGDATWPMAWYANEFKATDFSKPSAAAANNFDVILLDMSLLEQAKLVYPDFNIYSLPLRGWWVPGHNPTISQIFDYFFTLSLYPRTPSSGPGDLGVGDTRVLCLERAGPNSPFFPLPSPEFLTLIHTATPKTVTTPASPSPH